MLGPLPPLQLREVSLPEPLGTDPPHTCLGSSHSCLATSDQMTKRLVWHQQASAQPRHPLELEIRVVGSSNTLSQIQFSNRFTSDKTESTGSGDTVGLRTPPLFRKLLSINASRKKSPPWHSWLTDSQYELRVNSLWPLDQETYLSTLPILYYVYNNYTFNFSIILIYSIL